VVVLENDGDCGPRSGDFRGGAFDTTRGWWHLLEKTRRLYISAITSALLEV
jgi:hypothetical protein